MTKVVVLFLFSTFLAFSQSKKLDLTVISDELKENSNSIILKKSIDVQLISSKKMVVKTDKIITVFNENGLAACDAVEYYSKSTKIKKITIALYDKVGDLVRVFKQKDLKDYSVSQGYEITDGRMVFWDYTSSNFPITIHYQSEVESSTTAFIMPWIPVESFSQAVILSEYNISAEPSLGLREVESNFEGYSIEKGSNTAHSKSYRARNIPAVLQESYSPYSQDYMPRVVFGIERFSLENYEGIAQNWEQFSAWNYNNLIADTTELPANTQQKIRDLVNGIEEPLEKAKIIYKYMQDKTRYISIQLGIGGWKPMLAKDVDRLGYGDCKALTNYMRALLHVVGIDSYYSIVYGGNNLRDIKSDLIAMQGNHAILALPINGEMIWLECTSQTAPFGYIANFTDDREVLLIAPEKGRLVRTKKYDVQENTQVRTATIKLDATGGIEVDLAIVSKGNNFEGRSQIKRKSKVELEKYYKNYLSSIHSLEIIKAVVEDDLESIVSTEQLLFSAPNYGNIIGNDLIFIPNVVNGISGKLSTNKNRKAPFKISRSDCNTDELTISIPNQFEVAFLPSNVDLVTKYGEYHIKFDKIEENKLIYTRVVKSFSGDYPKEEYEQFRNFRLAIANNDQAKIVLKRK